MDVYKYNRFYQKLLRLTESKNKIIDNMIKTDDNFDLHTLYIKNMESKYCILFFHGNAGNLSMRFDMIKFLYNYASVLIFDYRSYGKSSGNKTDLNSNNLCKDAHTVWNYMVNDLGLTPNYISFFGESLGCSIAINLAMQLSKSMDNKIYPHSLVLNAPFYSMSSMIQNIFDKANIKPIGKIISFFIGREYQSNQWIKLINHQTKIIIAHSTRDEIIPYKEGIKLYETIVSTHPYIKFINISGTHNNLGLTDSYIYALADLFDDDE